MTKWYPQTAPKISYPLTGHSGKGITFATRVSKDCPRKLWYANRAKSRSEHQPSRQLSCGIAFHAYADLYHTGNAALDPESVAFEGQSLNQWGVAEAQALFRKYRARVAIEHYGEVRSTEEFFSVMAGCHEFTCRVDMLVEREGALWLVDFKTASWVDSNLTASYRNGMSAILYPYAVAANLPEQVAGMIFAIVEKGEGKLYETRVPYPDQDVIDGALSWYERQSDHYDEIISSPSAYSLVAKPTNCYKWDGQCEWLVACDPWATKED